MSLRGRYVIDRIKHAVGNRFRLPVPPYEDPTYWDNVYRNLGPSDVFEWGNISFRDLRQYNYVRYEPGSSFTWQTFTSVKGAQKATCLGESIGVFEDDKDKRLNRPILLLGCGNSSLGEDMVQAGWNGPIIHVDVSARVIDSMSHRCARWLPTGDMQFLQDDATVLSAFGDGTVAATIDKGLIDALFCADQGSKCGQVMQAVHRVLQPLGVFCCLSFSSPQFLLQHLLRDARQKTAQTKLWREVHIRVIDNKILLYRFQKEDAAAERQSTLMQLSSKRHRHTG